ncbi:MAG: OmpA family protein [Epsilonproteobacteria bacterium]|nr:OmpA family protein [Campylobacterota bacterium]
MGSKLILLLGLLVGAFLTLMCVNDKKNALTLKQYQQAQNSVITPSSTPLKEEIQTEPLVKPETVVQQEPTFAYSTNEGIKLSANFHNDDKSEALEQFILEHCKSDECTQDLSFDENIKSASWQDAALKIASFLKSNDVKNGAVFIKNQEVLFEGEFKDEAQAEAFNALVNTLDSHKFTIDNTTSIAKAPEVITPQPAVRTPEVVEITQSQINDLLTKNPIYFEFNSEILTPQSQEILDQIIATLNTSDLKTLRVEGHTDSGGSASYNKTLSQKRANSVKEYLISNGLQTLNIKAIGYGEERPISADPKETINRRVEIHLEQGE